MARGGVGVLAAATIVGLAAAADSAAATAPTVPTLTLLSGGKEFDFGSGREPVSHTFHFAIQPGLPSGQKIKVRPVDLVSGGHVMPSRSMRVGKRTTARGRMLTLVVRLDPAGAEPGEYNGTLSITAAGRVLDKVDLKAKLRSQVRSSGLTTILALAAILLGAVAGAILKWLSETGAKLQALENRYQRAVALLGAARLPAWVRQRLRAIQASLAALDTAQAETQLAGLESRLDAVGRVIVVVERLSHEVEQQRGRIDSLSDEDEAQLLFVVEREDAKLQEFLDSDPPQDEKERAALIAAIGLFSIFLRAFSDRDRREQLRPAIAHFVAEDYDAAKRAMETVPVPAETSAQLERLLDQAFLERVGFGAAVIGARATVGLVGRLWRSRRRAPLAPDQEPEPEPEPLPASRAHPVARWSVRYAGFVSGSIIAVIVTLVGMTLLYFPNETFGGAVDWLTLILWGFGVQLTGFSLAQLGGRTLGAGPKIEAPRA